MNQILFDCDASNLVLQDGGNALSIGLLVVIELVITGDEQSIMHSEALQ